MWQRNDTCVSQSHTHPHPDTCSLVSLGCNIHDILVYRHSRTNQFCWHRHCHLHTCGHPLQAHIHWHPPDNWIHGSQACRSTCLAMYMCHHYHMKAHRELKYWSFKLKNPCLKDHLTLTLISITLKLRQTLTWVSSWTCWDTSCIAVTRVLVGQTFVYWKTRGVSAVHSVSSLTGTCVSSR